MVEHLTERQRVAFELPCARAMETLAPEFRRVLAVGDVRVSTILTVNK